MNNSTQLKSIAELCSLEYGNVVFLAESVYAYLSSADDINKSDCSGDIQFRSEEQKNIPKALSILVYPNPSDGMIQLMMSDRTSDLGNIEVFAIDGKLVYSQKVGDVASYLLNLENLSNGTYLLKIIPNKGEAIVHKIQIIH